MSTLVERQLKSATDGAGRVDLGKLAQLVGAAYADYERTIRLQERSTQLMSQELNDANKAIRRERDETVAASQKRFELAVNGANDGIWDWNVTDDIFWCSTRMRTMLGYPEDAPWTPGLAGWLSLVDAADRPNAREFVDGCVAGGAPAPLTIKFRDAAGCKRYFMCRAAAVADDTGRASRVVGIQTDVTSMVLMNESLRHAQQTAETARAEAEKANAAKSEFLANMSHEIRTPLNGILGLTELLAESPLDSEQQMSVQAILRSGESLTSLLNDILDFSKIEAGQLVLEEVPFNLDDSLRSAVALVTPLVMPKGISVQYDYAADAPAHIVGDPTRINQIITNLLNNACKFTEAGHIRLAVRAARRPDGQALFTITVSDTGIGMSGDMQQKLFKKFSQGDASTTRKYGGTGLGLAITKKLADIMQGGIRVASREGEGTCFTVELPLAIASGLPVAQNGPAMMNAAPGAVFSNFRVLVVDDHPVNRMFTTKLLTKLGFAHIEEAENGVRAVEKMRQRGHAFDIVLMDCQMPEMDGFAAARNIRQMEKAAGGRAVPIIAMTAHAMEGDRDRCLRSGMDDYVSKPVRRAKLLSVLDSWLFQAPRPAAETQDIPPEETPLVDLAHIMEFTEGDPRQEEMLVCAFLETGLDCVAALADCACGRGDDKSWKSAAHKLKGSSAQLGARELAALCLVAEVNTQPDRRMAILATIEKKFADVRNFFAARGTLPARLARDRKECVAV